MLVGKAICRGALRHEVVPHIMSLALAVDGRPSESEPVTISRRKSEFTEHVVEWTAT